MLLFELLTLSTPYRLENIDPFKLAHHVRLGKRPRWPSYVAVVAETINEPRADGERDADEEMEAVADAVADANRVEYGQFVELFNDATELAPRDRPSARELVKRVQKIEHQIKLRAPLSLPKMRTRAVRKQ